MGVILVRFLCLGAYLPPCPGIIAGTRICTRVACFRERQGGRNSRSKLFICQRHRQKHKVGNDCLQNAMTSPREADVSRKQRATASRGH